MQQIEDIDARPNPCDFDVFFPWACKQLAAESEVRITKIIQTDYVSPSAVSERSRAKSTAKSVLKMQLSKDVDSGEIYYNNSDSRATVSDENEIIVRIVAVYDSTDSLVQLKFDKNKHIPRILIKILALIIQFYTRLTSIVINQGLDQYILYDFQKALPLSHITDMCLDGTCFKEANYYVLLNAEIRIKHLSLSRCNINDDILKTIAVRLSYPQPSSKTLSTLNLASNKITDLGISYLANALRSNRHLNYLNVSNNMLTDVGANSLFSSLMDFVLTPEELFASKRRLMQYIKTKAALINRMVAEYKFNDLDRKGRKKSAKSIMVMKKKGLEREVSASIPSSELETYILEKVQMMAETELGEFDCPFSRPNITSRNGKIFCYGNNVLCYLNLSYNNLTYASVKKLLDVLRAQLRHNRNPKGLLNVNIDGNILPSNCKELSEIDGILYSGLFDPLRKLSVIKRRPGGKSAIR